MLFFNNEKIYVENFKRNIDYDMSYSLRKITKKIKDFLGNKTFQLILLSLERLIGLMSKIHDLF